MSTATGFVRATKEKSYARVCLDGPSGSGKTWTGLTTAIALANGGRVAVIDSERGSASLYADTFEFDVMEIEGNYHPDKYVRGIRDAEAAGYDALLIDSLTHAWNGTGGVMEIVDAAKSRFGGNQHMAWAVGTPLWQGLLDAIQQSRLHVVATVRSKTRWVEEDGGSGKKGYRRAGTEPVARDGIEFEFGVVGDMDLDHTLTVSKSRAGHRLETMYRKPGPEFGRAVLAWIRDGVDAAPSADERAREVLALAPGRKAEAGAALRDAGITSDALVDDAVFEHARQIVANLPEPVVAEPAEEATPADPGDDGPPAEPAEWLMTDAQRRKLWATANGAGWDQDDMRAVVEQVTGDRSTSSLTSRDDYEQVLIRLEAGPAADAGPAQAPLYDEEPAA